MDNSILKHIDEPMLVLTADNISRIDFGVYFDEFAGLPSSSCMLVPVDPIDGIDGDYLHLSDDKKNILELNRSKVSEIYASGIQVLNPAVINSLTGDIPNSDNLSFSEIWKSLIKKDALFCSSIYLKNGSLSTSFSAKVCRRKHKDLTVNQLRYFVKVAYKRHHKIFDSL